ncbi:MAG: DNA repair protein RecN [Gammaproteobacteria bacterium]|nr:DNA repair protein RecN [Gammaproteobacteria bacterium]
MLTRLQLRDFVIVDRAELEFEGGLTALTGETGAGKSLVVDALSMIAGGRASGDVVRQGADRAEVSASFTAIPAAATDWLREQSIEPDDEVLARRIVGADGRSRAYLNGRMVPLQSLREIADLLIEIHGQQEFQHLVTHEAQRALLDEHAEAQPLAASVATIHAKWRECVRELDRRRGAAADLDGRRELISYQLEELGGALEGVTDVGALFLERRRIADQGRLGEAARGALLLAFELEDGSAHQLLAKAQAALRGPGSADPELQNVAHLLEEATIAVSESADALRRYLDALDTDPARQEEIERRAATLESLARKHKVRVEDLPAQLEALRGELGELAGSQVELEALERERAALLEAYGIAADELGAARHRVAIEFGRQITELMQSLGMPGGRFEVRVNTDPAEIGVHGREVVEFLVAANPGQAPRNLGKVASGGELSRIGLAIQVASAARTRTECLVFDEVDAGVGGATAEIVGRQLRALGTRGQVLCVTHLPQVASQADAQLRVTKETDGKSTRTLIERLDSAQRVEEIARMLGGVDVSERARAHAKEMLARGVPAAGAPRPRRSRGG